MADAKLAASLVRIRQRRTGPFILELDLTDGIAEGPPTDPVSALLTMRKTRLQDLLEGLRRAAADDRVRVLVVKVGGSRIGLAKIQELRAAIGDFRRSGKLTVAWAESFGDFIHGNLPYYLATGFDRIYLQPSGTLGLTGVAVEQVFLHDALEKLGVDFETAKRHEYKSAPDQLTESGFTGPAREGTESDLGAAITKDGKPVQQFDRLLDGYAHLTAFHSGDTAFARALSTGRSAGGTSGAGALTATIRFPESGAWRLFVQFQTSGVEHTAAFTVEVP